MTNGPFDPVDPLAGQVASIVDEAVVAAHAAYAAARPNSAAQAAAAAKVLPAPAKLLGRCSHSKLCCSPDRP